MVTSECPTCGAVRPHVELLHLTPTERRIYTFIGKHPQSSMERIFSHLYHDRADGGPLSAVGIHVMISRINNKLTDHRIQSTHRGPGSTYSLKRIEEKCPALPLA